MPFTLNFSSLVEYDAGQSSISLDVRLQIIGRATDFSAKLDTGSSDCIFGREHGEVLGLDIESGEPIRIYTATGVFLSYRHNVTLIVLNY